jgi:hypothetical protein
MKRDYSVLTWSDKGEQGAQWTHGTQTHPTLHSEAFHPTAEPAKKSSKYNVVLANITTDHFVRIMINL